MTRLAAKLSSFLVMLLGLPLLGVYLSGLQVNPYLQFPPKTVYIVPAPFSWPIFIVYAVLILAASGFFVVHFCRATNKTPVSRPVAPFPWWGWMAIGVGLTTWVLAWTRFSWFAGWQLHTFTPLWLSFVVVINALTYHRKGQCLMINRAGFFLVLFPVSAVFWWFFEYLNRFVQNWHYLGPEYGAVQYFVLATLPFSTVLPAVLSVREWLLSFPAINLAFRNSVSIRPTRPRLLAWLTLIVAAVGLTCIGIFPNYLFPLLWVSPGLIIISLQTLQGKPHILSDIARGDWTLAAGSALSALFCGWFWEMWNTYSLAKWQYAIPFVDRFHLFEMPVLGYAGYLPFGLECAAIGSLVSDWLASSGH